MNDKVIQSLATSWLRRVVVQAIVTVVFGGGLCCLMVGIAALPESLVAQEVKPWLFIGAFACLGGMLAVGLLVWVLVNNQRIFAHFDKAFTPLGFTRSRYLIRGLRYRGAYRARAVNVYYLVSGGRYFRSARLEIILKGNFHTRLGIGTQSALSSLGVALTGQAPLDMPDPAYEGLLIHPLDEAWSRQLLADSSARDAIVRLVGKDTPGVRGLHFGPETIRLYLGHFNLALLTPEAVRQWLEDLLALTEIGERLPAPTQTAAASQWESADRPDWGRYFLPALAVIFTVALCPILMAGCIIGILILQGDFP
jgi:hypothetical protein